MEGLWAAFDAGLAFLHAVRKLQLALLTLQSNGKAAIVDACFNTNAIREAALMKAQRLGAQVTFIEAVTRDPEVLRKMQLMNVQDAAWYVFSVLTFATSNACWHRYAGLLEEDAITDLVIRAEGNKKEYQMLDSSIYCWARLYDMGAFHPPARLTKSISGSALEVNNAQSYLQGRIMFYLMSFHANARPIYVRSLLGLRT